MTGVLSSELKYTVKSIWNFEFGGHPNHPPYLAAQAQMQSLTVHRIPQGLDSAGLSCSPLPHASIANAQG